MEKMEDRLLEYGGSEKKDNDLMRTLEQWEVVVMIETWLHEKG